MSNPTPRFVDYHCHLDLYPDYVNQFLACTDKEIATLAVTTTPRAWPRNRALAESSPFVRVALGFHPQLVAARAAEFPLFKKYFSETRFIGEVGLDASPQHYKSYSEQKEIFEQILNLCAGHGDKILFVHSVRATRDVLGLIERVLPPGRSRVVLHWFGGTKSEGEWAARLGCYFSVNTEMLTKDARRAVVATLPLNRILTETDGPFTNTLDEPSKPTDIPLVFKLLHSVFGTDEEELRMKIVANLNDLEGH
jgi:TatD DNase family protein